MVDSKDVETILDDLYLKLEYDDVDTVECLRDILDILNMIHQIINYKEFN